MMQTGRAHGMSTFETSIHDLIQKGLISKEDGNGFIRRRSAGKHLTSPSNQGIRLANTPAVS
jgi:Tfp pilus assembly pilus retraction ATPase PilT